MTDDEQLIYDIVVEVFDFEEVSPKSCAKPNTFYRVPTGIYIYDDSSYSMDFFDPLINLNHTMLVIESTENKEFIYAFRLLHAYHPNFPDDKVWLAQFVSAINGRATNCQINKSIGHAVCLASIMAVRSLKC